MVVVATVVVLVVLVVLVDVADVVDVVDVVEVIGVIAGAGVVVDELGTVGWAASSELHDATARATAISNDAVARFTTRLCTGTASAPGHKVMVIDKPGARLWRRADVLEWERAAHRRPGRRSNG